MHRVAWIRSNGTIPEAPWILKPSERISLKKRMREMRFPTGYGANIRAAFSTKGKERPGYLKTHEKYRILLDSLVIALQGLGSPLVYDAVVDLSQLLRYTRAITFTIPPYSLHDHACFKLV